MKEHKVRLVQRRARGSYEADFDTKEPGNYVVRAELLPRGREKQETAFS